MDLTSCFGSKGNGAFGDEVVITVTDDPSEVVTLTMWLEGQQIPCRWRSHYRSRLSELMVPREFEAQAREAVEDARNSQADPDELEKAAMEAAIPEGEDPSRFK